MALLPWKRSDDGRHDGAPHAVPTQGPGPHPGAQHAAPYQPGTDLSVTTGIPFVDSAFDRAVALPSAAIHAHVDRLRKRNPYASPAQIIALLEKQYLLAVSTSGGAVGAAAAAPAVGTGVGMALTTGEVAAFFAASSAFALAVADVHGIGVEETARRRTLLLATVLGEQGAQTVGTETGVATTAWAKTLLLNMPTTTIRRVNGALAKRLLRRQAGKQGALAIGRLAPFGIGAVIGATGARALGKTVVSGAQRAFGPPPLQFARTIELAVTGPDASAAPLRLVEPRDSSPSSDRS
ncbi:MAG: hypothetical protein JWP95_293 [Actinotalea sp.]|nr:hypothetical protein [Actinotalea sp.]